MVNGMRKLNADEEIEFYKEIIADPQKEKMLNNVRDSFHVLYSRSQLLLSLITSTRYFEGENVLVQSQV